ncbi:MAG: cupin domain-containing protein [Burkholderiales bacterium]|nr:MAG: cupin domain-containing protein [Burkholderiales bacterium]
MMPRDLVCVACAFSLFACTVTASAAGPSETASRQFAKSLPNLPGKSLVAVIVDYAPGAASRPHVHAKSAFIYAYVLSGAVETQLDAEPLRVVRAGESFYEAPGAHQVVSRNASGTEPARLLAIFVVDSAESHELTSSDR